MCQLQSDSRPSAVAPGQTPRPICLTPQAQHLLDNAFGQMDHLIRTKQTDAGLCALVHLLRSLQRLRREVRQPSQPTVD